MEPLPVGKLIDGTAQRDAVHIAIAPVIAGATLNPGQHVGWVKDDQRTVRAVAQCIGVIDPFLKQPVLEGQQCWLFLYPNTVTGLRHQWEHPAFAAEKPADPVASEKWLREYVAANSPYEGPEGYDRFVKDLREGHIFFHGTDLYSVEDLPCPAELVRHVRIVLGVELDLGKVTYRCSC